MSEQKINIPQAAFDQLATTEIIEVNGNDFIRKDLVVKMVSKFADEQVKEKEERIKELEDLIKRAYLFVDMSALASDEFKETFRKAINPKI